MTFTEFATQIMDLHAFGEVDVDGSGCLNVSEFVNACKKRFHDPETAAFFGIEAKPFTSLEQMAYESLYAKIDVDNSGCNPLFFVKCPRFIYFSIYSVLFSVNWILGQKYFFLDLISFFMV